MTTATKTETVVEVPSVTQALAAVIADLPGIGKDEKNQAQGWSYRGIEQMTAALQPLFGRHGVVFVPEVLSTETVDVNVGGKVWAEWRILMAWQVFGPGGDSIRVGPTIGVARNSGDKGANAAMTAAFKYALLHTFCVGDRADDPDAHVAETPAQAKDAQEAAARVQMAAQDLSELERGELRAWMAKQKIPGLPSHWTLEHAEQILAMISELEQDRVVSEDMEGSE